MALVVIFGTVNSEAQEQGLKGLILGAGGGALIGQHIGRDTDATLVGAAVGSMLGYIIGNEHDKISAVQGGFPRQPITRINSGSASKK